MVGKAKKTQKVHFSKIKVCVWEIPWEAAQSGLWTWNGSVSNPPMSPTEGKAGLYSETTNGTRRVTCPGCSGEQGQVAADKAQHWSLGT